MDWGLANRLSRIIKSDGRCVMLAIDHGYFLGPLARLEKPGETVEPLLPYADALMLTRGVLRTCIPQDTDMPMVLRMSAGNSIVGEALSDEGLMTCIEDAIRINASAITLSVYIGTRHEKQTLLNLGKLVDAGEKYGLPVLAVTAVGKELEKRDARYLKLCCRICSEIGAHFVKTYYCDDFEEVTGSCPVPIVIAGGPKLDTPQDAIDMARAAIERGACGVDMGRNVWQNDDAVGMIKAIRDVVHG